MRGGNAGSTGDDSDRLEYSSSCHAELRSASLSNPSAARLVSSADEAVLEWLGPSEARRKSASAAPSRSSSLVGPRADADTPKGDDAAVDDVTPLEAPLDDGGADDPLEMPDPSPTRAANGLRLLNDPTLLAKSKPGA
jgi:hypothetical protein